MRLFCTPSAASKPKTKNHKTTKPQPKTKAMAFLSHFLYHLYDLALMFLIVLLLEAKCRLRSAADAVFPSAAASQHYLDLVEKKLPTFHYSHRGDKSPETSVECVVCLSRLEEGAEIRELQCRHTFHRACLDTWLRKGCPTCPLCRGAVLPEDAAARSRRWLTWLRDEPVENYGSDEELVLLLSAVRSTNLHRWLRL